MWRRTAISLVLIVVAGAVVVARRGDSFWRWLLILTVTTALMLGAFTVLHIWRSRVHGDRTWRDDSHSVTVELHLPVDEARARARGILEAKDVKQEADGGLVAVYPRSQWSGPIVARLAFEPREAGTRVRISCKRQAALDLGRSAKLCSEIAAGLHGG